MHVVIVTASERMLEVRVGAPARNAFEVPQTLLADAAHALLEQGCARLVHQILV